MSHHAARAILAAAVAWSPWAAGYSLTAEQELHDKYLYEVAFVSPIQRHLATLRELAAEGRSAAEMGVSQGHSTWALLQGLHDASGGGADLPPRALFSYDLRPFEHEESAKRLARELDIGYSFSSASVLDVALPQDVDLLFIDTFHAFSQLRRELRLHAHRAQRFIALHDTEVDGRVSECVRAQRSWTNAHLEDTLSSAGWAMKPEFICRKFNIEDPLDNVKTGLWPAIEEFLSLRPEWELFRHFPYCNGLTVLRRVARGPSSLVPLPPAGCNLTSFLARSGGLEGAVPSWALEALERELPRLRRAADSRPNAWYHARMGLVLSLAPGKQAQRLLCGWGCSRKSWDHGAAWGYACG